MNKDKITLKVSTDSDHREFFVNDTYITFWTTDFTNVHPDVKAEFIECLTNDFYHDDEWYDRLEYLESAKISDDLLKSIVNDIQTYSNWSEIKDADGYPLLENDTIFTEGYRRWKEDK